MNDQYVFSDAEDFPNRLNGLDAGSLTLPDRFAGFADWRLPTIVELQTILLAPFVCGTQPCIDPVFGPTVPSFYWSATTFATAPSDAWYVSFFGGAVSLESKNMLFYVRAVRGGL